LGSHSAAWKSKENRGSESRSAHLSCQGGFMRKIVYIASPYTKGDVAVNVRESFRVATQLAESGYLPFPPLFSHFWHLLFPHPYEFWTALDLEWILRCDCVLRLPGESTGADNEVAFAKSHNIPVYFSIEELIAA
jgi:hypothetical protein